MSATADDQRLEVGQEVARRTFSVHRADLVRYAGASGDFNPIHWSERTAVGVGLPGVIAHGMFTMALAGRVVQDWCGGDPGRVASFGVRFTKPVVVAPVDASPASSPVVAEAPGLPVASSWGAPSPGV
ncbi:MaoC/PaaZ C-terminal domain-containing protein [Pseudokineococcus marinus]|uniref:Dehydratase n=1 Tax=Pseudokineococcus marinus TaxID=351215 RepID=A0A849BJB2_9ACTN|nr:MaoC/PaaZ C-terminal domain-containing protein [Pseudokineococcus marinus]NNH22711.1 dehydratase [Pseudokineococcus marinus]